MDQEAHSRPRALSRDPFQDLLASLIIFTICFALLVAPVALAKNPYELQESSEGDPGDGVLRPAPEIIEPCPVPPPRNFGLIFTADGWGDYRYDRPILILPLLFYHNMQPIGAGRMFPTEALFSLILREGRWQNAP